MTLGTNKAILMIMLVFHKHVFTFRADRSLAAVASMGNIFSETSLAKWLMLVDDVLFAS